MHIEQHAAQLRIFSFRRTRVSGLGQSDIQLLRNQPDGLGKSDVLDLLHEGENVSLDAAAEAMKKLPRGMHRERRRLLAMKRTKPGIVLRPRLAQLDVVANNADDVRLLLDDLFEVAGLSHGWERKTVAHLNCGAEHPE